MDEGWTIVGDSLALCPAGVQVSSWWGLLRPFWYLRAFLLSSELWLLLPVEPSGEEGLTVHAGECCPYSRAIGLRVCTLKGKCSNSNSIFY